MCVCILLCMERWSITLDRFMDARGIYVILRYTGLVRGFAVNFGSPT